VGPGFKYSGYEGEEEKRGSRSFLKLGGEEKKGSLKKKQQDGIKNR